MIGSVARRVRDRPWNPHFKATEQQRRLVTSGVPIRYGVPTRSSSKSCALVRRDVDGRSDDPSAASVCSSLVDRYNDRLCHVDGPEPTITDDVEIVTASPRDWASDPVTDQTWLDKDDGTTTGRPVGRAAEERTVRSA